MTALSPALRLISTRGPVATGLMPELAAFYQQQTGGTVEVAAADPGAVLATAQREGADLLLLEADELDAAGPEGQIVAARVAFIANDFLLIGPPDDPVRASTLASMLAIARRIAAAGAPFLTPNDGSAAHRREQQVWAVAGLTPGPPWYRAASPAAAGDSAAFLREALAGRCYALCDRVTVVTAPEEVTVLFDGDPLLRNDLVLALLDPVRLPGARFDLAAAFVSWATDFAVQQAIGAYGKERYGEALYLPLARYQWRPPQPASHAP